MSTSTVPNRMLHPLTTCLSPEVARQLVDARLNEDTQKRIDELTAKASRGTLNDDERAEFVEYIGFIKVQARTLISQ